MTKQSVIEVKKEIKRLQERIKLLEKTDIWKKDNLWWGSKESAAVKRSSMDLSRALTGIRSLS